VRNFVEACQESNSDLQLKAKSYCECVIRRVQDLVTFEKFKELDDFIRKHRDDLQEKLLEIYRGSPRTIAKAYKEATKALKKLEELTFSDAEIDAILPKALRKT